jgi:hypothetical protein
MTSLLILTLNAVFEGTNGVVRERERVREREGGVQFNDAAD